MEGLKRVGRRSWETFEERGPGGLEERRNLPDRLGPKLNRAVCRLGYPGGLDPRGPNDLESVWVSSTRFEAGSRDSDGGANGDGTYHSRQNRRWTVTDKAKRLEAANQNRAEAAVRWKDAENTADETGRGSDKVKAEENDRALTAADRKIKSIEKEP